MKPCMCLTLAYALPDSLSLDAAMAQGAALAAYARRDPAGFAFWACVWAGSLTATFLFLRMLFTRWGDTQVTRKTMALSVLLHLIVAATSTRFDLPLRGGTQDREDSIVRFHRRQVVDSESRDVDDNTPDTPGDSKTAGKPDVWDETPRFDEPPALRQPKEPIDTRAPELARTPTPLEPAADLSLPEATQPAVAAVPQPERLDTLPPKAANVPTSPAVEETAESRDGPAQASLRPDRAARAAPPSIEESAKQPVREPAAESNLVVRSESNLTVAVPDIAPLAAIRRDVAVPDAKQRAAPAAPETPAAADAEPLVAGTPVAAGKAFSRVEKPQPTETRPAPAERTLREDSSALGTQAAIASRVAVVEPASREAAPQVRRSESAGAIEGNAGQLPAPYRLRGLPDRAKFALEMGATQESERAVQASLQWLARNQHQSGYWPAIEATLGREPPEDPPLDLHGTALGERQRSGFHTETGLTALALLAFLGANYTHEDNVFADNVGRGLRWLVSQQDAEGFLGGRANKYGRMYCHGMATIALGEAYGITKDPQLRGPLERAVQYIVVCQNRHDGGWRYLQGYRGDMSIFGWQLMALKSARTAGLEVPDATFDRAIDFLIVHGRKQRQSNQSRYGGLAGYRISINSDTKTETLELPKPSMTAEALFCKQMLGIDRKHASYAEAIDYLQANLPRRSKQNLYYWYYGTLAMYQNGGEPWQRWNESLRDTLVADQRTDGKFAGSWNPRAPWGDFGGRVFSTSLSTLCLEVYYRFLPLYQFGDGHEKHAAQPDRPAQ